LLYEFVTKMFRWSKGVCDKMKTSKDKKEEATNKIPSPVKKEVTANPTRPEMAEMINRHFFGLDKNRPEAVAKRLKKNQRTARANVEDHFNAGSRPFFY